VVASSRFTAIWNTGDYTAHRSQLVGVTLPAREAVVLINEPAQVTLPG
jgi:hypothetical protein